MQLVTDITLPAGLEHLDTKLRPGLLSAFESLAAGLEERVAANITTPDARGRVINASGELLASLRSEVEESADYIDALVRSDAAHATFVEHGRRPGPVPIAVIMEWLLVKGITPQQGTLQQAAAAIARKIQRDGVEGRHPFARALEESDDLVDAALCRAVEKIQQISL